MGQPMHSCSLIGESYTVRYFVKYDLIDLSAGNVAPRSDCLDGQAELEQYAYSVAPDQPAYTQFDLRASLSVYL